MDLYSELLSKKTKISIVGLGYVGLPIAVAFAKKVDVIGFDISKEKVELYQSGVDVTQEVGDAAIQASTVHFTYEEHDLKEANFHIVAVPTPVSTDRTPDLGAVKSATEIVGRNLKEGAIVVFESTVYPGVTEDVCIPILEAASGLVCGKSFKVGYSPERINPGDQIHRLETIVKVVSGMDEASLDQIAKVYEIVVEAGVYKAESIKVAEAAKVIENSQRDINIAFMNELSIIFNKMGIDTKSVLKASATKWNFLNFTPGLVGGHCIGVDPYYLTYKAEQLGYHSQIILSGRRINDDMGKYVAENIIKQLIKAGISIAEAKVAVLGITFKENCPDIRNTKVIDIIEELKEYGIRPIVADPQANPKDVMEAYRLQLIAFDRVENMDAVVIAVNHQEFTSMDKVAVGKMFGEKPHNRKVLIDVKGMLDRNAYEALGYNYWRL
ncbi:MAG: nucleotide sugar dehydrogenase [Clostridia bacterium]|nr:nucleotide sugar dehydrogenase [Clostridia bacterium]